MTDPIEIVNLRKEFKDFRAVDDLTFTVKRNSFTGFLGPNGAGKSTTLKILTHLINATSGNAYLNGIDVTVDAKNALRGVGTVVETPEFYGYLTPKQTFEYIGSIFGMRKEDISAQTVEILEDMKMSEWADSKIGTFSKGMKQRVCLGLSMLNNPSIIILDEPTSGLDPQGMAETRDILKNLRKKNNDLTILMSSHMLHEVTDLCDRITMINHGKLLMEGTMEDVLKTSNYRGISLKILGGPTEEAVHAIAKLPNVNEAEIAGYSIKLRLNGGDEEQGQLLDDIRGLGLKVYSFSEEEALENVYLSQIKEE